MRKLTLTKRKLDIFDIICGGAILKVELGYKKKAKFCMRKPMRSSSMIDLRGVYCYLIK